LIWLKRAYASTFQYYNLPTLQQLCYFLSFLTSDFLTSVVFETDLLTVSILAFDVSVAGLTVSIFIEVSEVVLVEEDESTLAESAAPPDLLPLQAAKDKETTIAKRVILNEFFMVLMFKMLIINSFEGEMFVGSPKVRKSGKTESEKGKGKTA
jgi:hypothetical protein